MKNKAIIFDLDGTLLDSLEDIAVCANKVLEEFSLPTHEIENYKKFVGSGAEVLIRNCSPKDLDEKQILALLESFKNIYEKNLHSCTKPYDGIYELLEKLYTNNINFAVLSNKPHEFTVKYVEKFFSQFNIQEIHGQKELIPKKPNPKAAIDIAKALKIPCENFFFVGDTDVDMKTAKNANMKAVGVKWGFRDESELLENGADYIVKKPLDIFDLL